MASGSLAAPASSAAPLLTSCLPGSPPTKRPSKLPAVRVLKAWGAVPWSRPRQGLPGRGRGSGSPQIKGLAETCQPLAPQPGCPHPQGTQEGTASLLIGSEGDGNYKAGLSACGARGGGAVTAASVGGTPVALRPLPPRCPQQALFPLSQKGPQPREERLPGKRPSAPPALASRLPHPGPGGPCGLWDTLLRSPRPSPPIRPTWLQPHLQQRSGHCPGHGQARAAQRLGTRSPTAPAQVSPGLPSPATSEALTVCSLWLPSAQLSRLTALCPSAKGAGPSPGRPSDPGAPQCRGQRAG